MEGLIDPPHPPPPRKKILSKRPALLGLNMIRDIQIFGDESETSKQNFSLLFTSLLQVILDLANDKNISQ